MIKFTAHLKGSRTTISLRESLLGARNMYVKKASIFWLYENIKEASFTTSESGKVSLSPGFWTFDDIANQLKEYGATLTDSKADGKCTLATTTNKIVLDATLMSILGFESSTFNKSTTTKSQNRVDVNRGLKYIKIHCDIINKSINENGYWDNILMSIPARPIYGSIQEYTDIESRVGTSSSIINRIIFNVEDQDGKPVDVGEILLDFYII